MRARRSWWGRLRRFLFWTLLLLLPLLSVWAVYEMHTSRLQSRLLHRYANTLSWTLQPGPSQAIQFPRDGPFDKRLLDPVYVQAQETLLTRGWRRLREVVSTEDAIVNYPLPEVRARMREKYS